VKTEILDVSGLTDEALTQARVFREPGAMALVKDAMDKIQRAADVLKRGGLVAFPTETVYGLGANAFDDEAVLRVYRAKGRPSDNPMIVHICRAGDIRILSGSLSPGIVKLADAFWPGPLTMVLEKLPEVPARVTGGLDTVGARLPDSLVATELIRLAGTPVAAPSANLSGRPSPTKAEHVIADLDGKADVILAGRPCRVGIESTVVDMTVDPPQVLRPGVVTKDDIEAALGTQGDIPFVSSGAVTHADAPRSPGDATRPDAPRSPGMKYRHYAPKARMVVVEGARDKVNMELARLKALNERLGLRVGILLFEESGYIEAAHDFYAKLRELDDEGNDLIIAGALSENDGIGFAVMNRMMKAAGHNIVRV